MQFNCFDGGLIRVKIVTLAVGGWSWAINAVILQETVTVSQPGPETQKVANDCKILSLK